jgi:FdhE protein
VTGVPSPLLEYVCEIALKTALEHFSEGVAPDVSDGWQEGYCPVCGSRAGMAELSGEEGKRSLFCSACTFRWAFKRLQCPFCGNDEVETLSYFVAGEGATRVDTCTVCSRYIKTRDSRKGNADVPLDVEDLLTIHLDLLAAREGFERGK